MYTHSRLILIPIAACIVFLYGLVADIHLVRLISKPIPVLYLLWFAYMHPKVQISLKGALIFSIVGDIILELPHHLPFALGLASFLVAHLFFIRSFLHTQTKKLLWPFIPIMIYCSTLYWYMLPNLGPLEIPVALYVFIISLMLWSASRYAYTHKHYIPLIGAIIFAISDSLIAVNKFIEPFPQTRYAIILTYWLAQFLICTLIHHEQKNTQSHHL